MTDRRTDGRTDGVTNRQMSIARCDLTKIDAHKKRYTVENTMFIVKATPTIVGEAFIFYLRTFFATHRYSRETT